MDRTYSGTITEILEHSEKRDPSITRCYYPSVGLRYRALPDKLTYKLLSLIEVRKV